MYNIKKTIASILCGVLIAGTVSPVLPGGIACATDVASDNEVPQVVEDEVMLDEDGEIPVIAEEDGESTEGNQEIKINYDNLAMYISTDGEAWMEYDETRATRNVMDDDEFYFGVGFYDENGKMVTPRKLRDNDVDFFVRYNIDEDGTDYIHGEQMDSKEDDSDECRSIVINGDAPATARIQGFVTDPEGKVHKIEALVKYVEHGVFMTGKRDFDLEECEGINSNETVYIDMDSTKYILPIEFDGINDNDEKIYAISGEDISYDVEDESILTINSKGRINALKPGKTRVSITYGDSYEIFYIEVADVENIGGITYALDYENMTAAVYAFDPENEKITIPDTIKFRRKNFTVDTILNHVWISSQYLHGTVNIPATITNIEMSEFNQEPNCFEYFNVAADNEVYESYKGAIYDKGLHTLVAFPSKMHGEMYELPEVTENIGEYAFGGDMQYEEITYFKLNNTFVPDTDEILTLKQANFNMIVPNDNMGAKVSFEKYNEQFVGQQYPDLFEIDFNMAVDPVSNVKFTKTGTSTATVTWTKPENDTFLRGYQISAFNSDDDSDCDIESDDADLTSVKLTGLKAGEKYRIAITPKSDSGNKTSVAVFARVEKKFATAPGKVAIKKPVTAKKAITVKWSKKKGTGYQVQIAKDRKFKKSLKTYKVGKAYTSKKISKLKKGTTYYVRVRAYNVNGNTAYGAWSSVKKIKCK